MKPRKKPGRPKPAPRGPRVELGYGWQTPPPEPPGEYREVVIGLMAGKPEKRGGKR